MSNLVPLQETISAVATRFEELAKIHGAVNFKSEASFAMQVLKQNDYLAKMATSNPESLRDAVINVAAIGLTLNPAHKYAYLVPRKKVCLDISYMGLIQLACESGAVKWVQAEIVRENDSFSFNGVGLRPTHQMNPFGDRGKITGAYAMAKTEDGEFLTTTMSIEEIYAIRDRGEAWKAFSAGKTKSCPWSTDEGEMIKKTVIKRAFKTWPKNNKLERLSTAVEILNNDEGINFNKEQAIEMATEGQITDIRVLLKGLNKSESDFIAYFSRVIKRDIREIDDLNTEEAKQALIQLRSFKPRGSHENA